MKSFSQNNEDLIIYSILSDISMVMGYAKNAVLDIGANDGITFSNRHNFIAHSGWAGVLVEPVKEMVNKIKKLYPNRPDVHILEAAISDTGKPQALLKVSGSILGKNNDSALVSTLSDADYQKWKGATSFRNVVVKNYSMPQFCAALDELVKEHQYKFKVISIDAEGFDYYILSGLDLKKYFCYVLCIEYNGIDKEKYVDLCSKQGFTLHTANAENLIFYRK
jgi:FkbM family methyltransferase